MNDRSTTKRINNLLIQPWKVIRRIPFTLCMIIILLVVAWATHSYFQELARTWVSRLGFAPHDFWLLRWERLILSTLVTSGGIAFWIALVMVALTSGVAEWRAGSWSSALTFWGVHLMTLVLEALIFSLPLHQLGITQARALFFSRDVGPSAGYMGSLGYITTFLPKPWRRVAFEVILAYLIIALFLPARTGSTHAIELSDDLAHLLAYPLGWAIAFTMERKKSLITVGGNMSDKSIAQRLFIKPGNKFLLVNPPAGYAAQMGELPAGVTLLGDAHSPVEVIQVFAANRGELEAQLPRLKALLTPKGMLWVTYYKGTSKVKTDINRDTINAYVRSLGLTGVAMISFHEDWSALRLKLT